MKRQARKDRNHHEVADAFEAMGWSVLDLSQLGNGVPDLLVARGGQLCLVEVKGPKGTLTPDQVEFQSRYRAPVYVVRTVEDVQRIAGAR